MFEARIRESSVDDNHDRMDGLFAGGTPCEMMFSFFFFFRAGETGAGTSTMIGIRRPVLVNLPSAP